jgi:hypothetical protein
VDSTQQAGSTKSTQRATPFAGDQQVETKKARQFDAVAKSVKELFPEAISRKDVASAADAGAVLARMFNNPDIEEQVAKAAAKLEGADREKFVRNLGAYALMTDSAATMLDYQACGTGWDGWDSGGDFCKHYPEDRQAYRLREYPRLYEFRSQARQERSRAQLGEALSEALAGKGVAKAVEKSLVEQFITQIGVDAETSKEWKPTAEGVSKALDQELFIPLRALYDASGNLDHRGINIKGHDPQNLNRMSREAVTEMVRHVAEGDFDDWRFNHEKSRVQLECLTPAQEEAFRAPVSIEKIGRAGKKLSTHDEQGAGLFWVTKIGGPSHGFDMLSQCLLGLVANARNSAIVIDEDGHKGLARSIMRLVPTAEGQPMLYLEMLQVDFPRYMSVDREELRKMIYEHALAKARAMGVPLAIAPSRHESAEAFAKKLGVRGQRQAVHFVLHPSAAVFEASDTLLGQHHSPQTKLFNAKLPNPKSWNKPLLSNDLMKPFIIEP